MVGTQSSESRAYTSEHEALREAGSEMLLSVPTPRATPSAEETYTAPWSYGTKWVHLPLASGLTVKGSGPQLPRLAPCPGPSSRTSSLGEQFFRGRLGLLSEPCSGLPNPAEAGTGLGKYSEDGQVKTCLQPSPAQRLIFPVATSPGVVLKESQPLLPAPSHQGALRSGPW